MFKYMLSSIHWRAPLLILIPHASLGQGTSIQGTVQYTCSSENATILAVFPVDHATTSCKVAQ
jgi:hypothetical protein